MKKMMFLTIMVLRYGTINSQPKADVKMDSEFIGKDKTEKIHQDYAGDDDCDDFI